MAHMSRCFRPCDHMYSRWLHPILLGVGVPCIISSIEVVIVCYKFNFDNLCLHYCI